jgi:hypothetical protein
MVLRPRTWLAVSLLACSAMLPACSAPSDDDATGNGAGAATSAQDVEVAKLRRRFAEARILQRQILSTSSPTGMTTRWANCTERSAASGSTTVQTVSYAFVGSADGESIANSGTGFGKVFLEDASQGSNPSLLPELVGYPAQVATTDMIQLDVVRQTDSGDLIVERIAKPAADRAATQKTESASATWERSVYSDSRAYATAYVWCPAAGRSFEAKGAPVRFYDDCQDPAFTRVRLKTADMPDDQVRKGICSIPSGVISFLSSSDTFVEIHLVPRSALRLGVGDLSVEVERLPLATKVSVADNRPSGGQLFDFTVSGAPQKLVVDRKGTSLIVSLDGETRTFTLEAGFPPVTSLWLGGRTRGANAEATSLLVR